MSVSANILSEPELFENGAFLHEQELQGAQWAPRVRGFFLYNVENKNV